jgi:uncharacterized membrane protein YjgN (DUF898 family)
VQVETVVVVVMVILTICGVGIVNDIIFVEVKKGFVGVDGCNFGGERWSWVNLLLVQVEQVVVMLVLTTGGEMVMVEPFAAAS